MGLKRRFFEQIDSWRPQKEATKGTENVLEILSDFGEAAAIASRTGRKRPPHEIHADLPLSGLKQKPPRSRSTENLENPPLPNTLHVSFSWCRGRFSASNTAGLDVAASPGAACHSDAASIPCSSAEGADSGRIWPVAASGSAQAE